jgi:hypothetical protein
MSVNLHDMPPRAVNDKAPHLVTDDAWTRVHEYIKLITVKDDGETSKATETSDGIIVSRST